MADYHSLMRRTVSALEPDTEEARRSLYDRARRKLDEALAELDAPVEELNAERAALEGAIARIEAEMPCRGAGRPGDGPAPARAAPERRRAAPVAPKTSSAPRPPPPAREQAPASPQGVRPAFPAGRPGGIALAVGAVVLVLIGATYLWLKRSPGAVDHASKPETPAATVAERFSAPEGIPGSQEIRDASVKDSSTRSQLSYVYRRQPVFYRTTEAAGTVIIDKPQHFIYVVQPNNVAIRYGIGVGDVCEDLGGLLRISNKVEWPTWSPANEGAKQEQPTKIIAGGVDNPLGARAMYMGDETRSIHGTNAPESVGGSIPYGCIGLVNDQVIDLYGRVPVGTRVIARN